MEWRPIKDYEDRYMVSNTGLIKAKERMLPNNLTGTLYKKPEVILKPNTVAFGYQQVTLYKEGKRKCKYVHVLVMEAFKGKKPLGYEINHIDEDKTNNNLNNLEFLTPIENNNYGTRKSDSERKSPINSNGYFECSANYRPATRTRNN